MDAGASGTGSAAWSRGLGLEGWGVLLLSLACVAMLAPAADVTNDALRAFANLLSVTREVVPYLLLLWGLVLLAIDSVAFRRRARVVVALVVLALIATTIIESMRWDRFGLRVLEIVGATFFGAGVFGGTLLATAGRRGATARWQRLVAAAVFALMPLAAGSAWVLRSASMHEAIRSFGDAALDVVLVACEWIPAAAIFSLVLYGAFTIMLLLGRIVHRRRVLDRAIGASCLACGHLLPPDFDSEPDSDPARCPECGATPGASANDQRAVDAVRSDPAWRALVLWGAAAALVSFVASGTAAASWLVRDVRMLMGQVARNWFPLPHAVLDVATTTAPVAAMTVVLFGWPATGARRIDGPAWWRPCVFGLWFLAAFVAPRSLRRRSVFEEAIWTGVSSTLTLLPYALAVLWLARVDRAARADRTTFARRGVLAGLAVAGAAQVAMSLLLRFMFRHAGILTPLEFAGVLGYETLELLELLEHAALLGAAVAGCAVAVEVGRRSRREFVTGATT